MKITKTVMKISYADMIGIMNSISASETVFIACDYGQDMPLINLLDQLSLVDFMPFLVHAVGAEGIQDCLLNYCRLFQPTEKIATWDCLVTSVYRLLAFNDYSAQICSVVMRASVMYIRLDSELNEAIPILQEMCKLEAYANRPIKAFTQEFINTYNQ